MTGREQYNNKYDRLSRNRIEKFDESWMLNGFYSSLIIKKSYTTAYVYLSYVVHFLESIDDINSITVDNYYSFLALQKGKSQTTQIDAYHALQRYSKYLKARGICEDYMSYVERPKFFETASTKEKRENGYLTKHEANEVIDRAIAGRPNYKKGKCWARRDYAIIMIFLTTGIRCSALYKMDVDDVDFENKTISVFEKGDKPRIISVPDKTIYAIKDYLKYRDKLGLDKSEKALMISVRRRRMETQSIYHVIKSASENINGKKISPHKLRATFGTQLYENTHDLYFVQQCMGHSNPKTTELYIRGQNNNTSQKAAELMSQFLD